eukprot:CAMPEP_0174929552 /NCGR_PEP_ID=MMETSP1355-20121228/27603_1 /TAXON_ID=464990 /ORGANISM="Hemiselmis tepida, Strain CCMP443" /LENGTH=240 /DNA_ID=CAMNT_0016175765 /DNA_START=64 /DNA_END=786 /DNA_ORIENTATION=+
MPTWNAQTLAVSALTAYYMFYGVRAALGDESAVPDVRDGVKSTKLLYVQTLGYHMLMDVCLMIGVVVNDIAHVMMPAFVAAMLAVVFSQFIIDDLRGAAPAAAFALVFAFLVPGAPARKPIKWNLATGFFTFNSCVALLVGIAMVSGDDSAIPKQMKPLSLNQIKFIGTTEFTLAAYMFGSILVGHAHAMQLFCVLFLCVACALHWVIGDIAENPVVLVFAMAHLCLWFVFRGKDEAKKQ